MENKNWNDLLGLFMHAKNEKKMDELLNLFLTITEREFLIDRYRIIEALLTSDLPQREISKKLNVSIARITAGSNELKRTPQEIKEFFIDYATKRKKPRK
jgi:TrpR family trp operon transcriptional repressor